MNVNGFLLKTHEIMQGSDFLFGIYVIIRSIWFWEYGFLALCYSDLYFRIGLFVDVFRKDSMQMDRNHLNFTKNQKCCVSSISVLLIRYACIVSSSSGSSPPPLVVRLSVRSDLVFFVRFTEKRA